MLTQTGLDSVIFKTECVANKENQYCSSCRAVQVRIAEGASKETLPSAVMGLCQCQTPVRQPHWSELSDFLFHVWFSIHGWITIDAIFCVTNWKKSTTLLSWSPFTRCSVPSKQKPKEQAGVSCNAVYCGLDHIWRWNGVRCTATEVSEVQTRSWKRGVPLQ